MNTEGGSQSAGRFGPALLKSNNLCYKMRNQMIWAYKCVKKT
jgi:hypothetical protein